MLRGQSLSVKHNCWVDTVKDSNEKFGGALKMVTEKQLNEVNSLLDALCNTSFALADADLFSFEFRNTIEDALSFIREQVRTEANLMGAGKFK